MGRSPNRRGKSRRQATGAKDYRGGAIGTGAGRLLLSRIISPRISETWKTGPGIGQKVVWPEHVMLANGNEGVAGEVQRDIGTIGYVEYGIARKAGLGMAILENKAGKYIEPTGDSGLDTLIQTKMPANLRLFIPDPNGADSYPIVTYSWLLVRRHYDDQAKSAALKDLIHWCLNKGQESSESLGYVRLAPHVVSLAMAATDSTGLRAPSSPK